MNSMHKNVHRRVYKCLWVIGREREGSRRVALSSGVLEVKHDLDRTGMEKIDKNGKNCMHWNVASDALHGSATNGPLA